MGKWTYETGTWHVKLVVVVILGGQEVLSNIECNEGDSSNAKARKGTLESVSPGERTLVSPSVTKAGGVSQEQSPRKSAVTYRRAQGSLAGGVAIV